MSVPLFLGRRRVRWPVALTAIVVLAVVLAVGLTACDGDKGTDPRDPAEGDDPGRITTLQSSLRRASPEIPQADLEALVAGNTTFALDLYQSLRGRAPGNLFFSPHSISLALSMTWAGAEAETAAQMADVLRVGLPQARQHDAFNALDLALESRGEAAEEVEGRAFQLRVANSIWGQQGFDFKAAFLDRLAASYGAGLHLVDFAGAADTARRLINDRVAEQTENRIEDLLPEGSVNGLTRLVLTNAIYFNASWQEPFEPSRTADGPFTTLAGDRVTVPMMHQSIRTGYAEGDGWQAVDLPYVGGQVSMLVIAPAAGAFEAFENGLDAQRLNDIVAGLGDHRVALTLPRFELEAEAGLAGVLQGLGMPLAFAPPGPDSGADFSGMNGRRDLFLHDVRHKAFVSVDEAGTEAAAATAVVVGVTSMPQPATLVVDRPFLLLVRDRDTQAVLFLGRVVDPKG